VHAGDGVVVGEQRCSPGEGQKLEVGGGLGEVHGPDGEPGGGLSGKQVGCLGRQRKTLNPILGKPMTRRKSIIISNCRWGCRALPTRGICRVFVRS
jgi:hypothetical protein